MVAKGIEYLLIYFDPDWTDDFGSWEELIDEFVAAEPDKAREAVADLRFILVVKDEDDLRNMCQRLRVPWDFAGMAGSYTAWFTGLLERIEQQLAGQP